MRAHDHVTLLQVLNDVRHTTNPPGPCFIDGLDEHIWKALPVSTTGVSSLNPRDILEMQGPAGSGKTSLLYFLSMTSILPFKLNVSYLGSSYEIVLGGRGKAVVVCDCDGQWSSPRLEDIISAHVLSRVRQTIIIGLESESIDSDNLANDISPSVSTIVSASLERIHIFRPTSSLAFAATLIALPSYHISSMPDQEICMLMIDSISAFHWPDRWSSTSGDEIPIHRILTALNELRERFGFVTFITNWSLLPPLSTPIHVQSSQAQTYHKEDPMYAQQHLPPPYPSPFDPINSILLARPTPNRSVLSITHHISLFVKRDSAPSSSAGETLDKGPKERIVAYIRTPVTLEGDLHAHTTSVPMANAVGSALRPQVLEGQFEFRLGPDGIIWPEE